MRRSLWIANPGFVPVSPDPGVHFLRVALEVSMLALHGWGKLTGFPAFAQTFPDPLGLGRHASLGLALFAEVFCAVLLIAGALTRFAALALLLTMGVAFFKVHGGGFSAPGAETAALYLFGFGALLISGGGRLSGDAADAAGGPWAMCRAFRLRGRTGGLSAQPPVSGDRLPEPGSAAKLPCGFP